MITDVEYSEILSYCKKRISFKSLSSKINYIDVAHNVIASPDFGSKLSYYLVDKYIYAELNDLTHTLYYEDIDNLHRRNTPELLVRCKICDNDFPYSYYKCVKNICCQCYRSENKDKKNASARKSYYKNREKNKEKDRAKCKVYREKNKEKTKEYNKNYKQINKEKIKEYNLKYREKNLEKINAQRKEYREKNKDKLKEWNRKNRERYKELNKKNE